jgi:polysaccharide biosynthesis protein PslG
MKGARILFLAAAVIFGGTAFADVNSPYGINSHVPDNATLDRIAGAGIGWIRVDMNWFQMEPGRDSYNWGFMDTVVNQARARGLEVFATLAYTPAWANGTGNIADPPLDTADWYDFVFDTVSRYKSKVKYWGMWNEPNLDSFFTGSGWQYREWILKPGSQAAKAADPACFVLGPDLAHLNSADYPSWM